MYNKVLFLECIINTLTGEKNILFVLLKTLLFRNCYIEHRLYYWAVNKGC